MLFNSTDPIPQPMANAIIRAVLPADIFAQVHVDSATRQILIEGQLPLDAAVTMILLQGV